MPLHEVGYRPWDQPKTSIWTRWLTISESGIRLALTSRWVRRLLLFAWLPVLLWGSFFFSIETLLFQSSEGETIQAGPVTLKIESGDFETLQQLQNREQLSPAERAELEQKIREMARQRAVEIARGEVARGFSDELDDEFGWLLPDAAGLKKALEEGDEGTARNIVWSSLLLTFFRIPQGLLILFLVGIIGPGLIARDIRSRAFLLYFSKPITVSEYILGKFVTLVFFIVMVTTLPAIALYLLGVMLSPDFSVIWNTWDIPIRIVVATAFLVVPTVSLVLMLSSLTQETRFAGFAWFAIWALGQGAYFAVLVSQAIRLDMAPVDPAVTESPLVSQWSVVSLYNDLGSAQQWVFGFSSLGEALPALIALSALTIVSLVILFRRVRANIRA